MGRRSVNERATWWRITPGSLAVYCLILSAGWLMFGPPTWWEGPIIVAALLATRYVISRIWGLR